jgi:hypothetical protein
MTQLALLPPLELGDWNVQEMQRMSNQRAVQKVYEGSMAGRRCRDRQRLRWIDDVEKDVGSVDAKRWRKRALDIREWAATVKGAKAKLLSAIELVEEEEEEDHELYIHYCECLILWHVSAICSPFSSHLITANFSLVQVVFHFFFLRGLH